MEVLILVLVVIGALLANASGVWVATALVTAISSRSRAPVIPRESDEKKSAEHHRLREKLI